MTRAVITIISAKSSPTVAKQLIGIVVKGKKAANQVAKHVSEVGFEPTLT
jgi:hypothetical protein